MKKLLLISFTIGAFNLAVNAQSDEQRPAPSNTPVVKESKIKQKLQKEQDFNDAINAVNINADQQATLRDLFKSSEQELRDLKANNALTPEQKAAKKAEILSVRSTKLKKILGDEKFKLWNTIRNKQKGATNGVDNATQSTSEQ